MRLKSVKQLKNLKGKRVLVRCNFDVPLKKIKTANKKTKLVISDERRLQTNLATINYLLKQRAQVILIGHLGRPQGRQVQNLSLQPVAQRLEKLLARKIKFIKSGRYIDASVFEAIKSNPSVSLFMLENLRFSDREEANCRRFAKQLAKLADIYVNEAFAVSHRQHASINAIQNYLPSYAGLNLVSEIEHLSRLFTRPQRPLVLIIGGAKIATKLPVIEKFIQRADYFLIGGAVANTFLQALGYPMGKSLLDKKYLSTAKKIIHNLGRQQQLEKFILPLDIKTQKQIKAVNNLSRRDMALDIGPQTLKLYLDIIKSAKTIIWNGPLGKFEEAPYRLATQAIARAVLKSSAHTVVGGGDTDEIFKKLKINRRIFISSGGGAMLSFLAGQPLPGLVNLIK